MRGKIIESNASKTATILLILVLVSTVFSACIWAFHGQFRLGIMLEEGMNAKFGDIVQQAFVPYDEYFSTLAISERFSTSEVRTNKSIFLSKDFNNASITMPLRRNYSVDAVLIVTDRPLGNWIDHLGVFWGEANPKSASAVMTIVGYGRNPASDQQYIHHKALHEVFHLLGYIHESHDEESIMWRSGYGLNLTPSQSFDMPYRATFAPLLLGNDLWLTFFSMSAINALIFLPYLFVVVYFARKYLSKYSRFYARWRTDMVSVARDFCILFFLMVIAASIVAGMIFSMIAIFLVDGLQYCVHEIRTSRKGGAVPMGGANMK